MAQRIHFIAIGGAAMHQLAIALHLNGHHVTGSDDEIFDPALTNLKMHGLIEESYFWDSRRITPDIDVVILGMHARSDNPELQKALEIGLDVVSFPEFIYRNSQTKKRVVIGGSHGKTTITSMIMHVLRDCGRPFDYLVGSRIEGFDVMVSLSDEHDLMVIEGDEYLSSCLDHRPKFHAYHPDIAVISGIEWDHINVFPDYSDYLNAFVVFTRMVPHGGSIVWCENDEAVRNMMEKYDGQAHCIPYQAMPSELRGGGVSVLYEQTPVPVSVFGEHNMQNMSAAYHVCSLLGISGESFFASISTFNGAARRLERIFENSSLKVYRDFAHAPSKLRATVRAVRSRFPEAKLLAVFELHTFSSMNRAFLPQYSGALDLADVPVVFFSPHAFELKRLVPFTPDEIRDGFACDGLQVFSGVKDLEQFIKQHLNDNMVLLLMSSGNFDGMKFDNLFDVKS